MIKKLLRNIFVGILAFTVGIFLIDGVKFIPELDIYSQVKVLLLAGSLLGVVNTILLPLVNFILLPVRIITLGIFNIIIAISMVFIVDYIFEEIVIVGFLDFFLLALIVWILSLVFAIKDKKD